MVNDMSDNKPKKRKQAMTLSIRPEVIQEAKQYHINASQAAEDGIALAIKKEKERQWLQENKEWIEEYNERIRTQGPLIRAYWLNEDWTVNEEALLKNGAP